MCLQAAFRLLLASSLLIGWCRATKETANEEPRILILGAGMAGVSAARTLQEAGHQNFLLIEGSSRIGGRIKSEQLSGHTVELGAMWVYGAGTNPIYKLLNKYNISMAVDYPDTWTVRDTSGDDVTDMADDIKTRLEASIEKFDSDSKSSRLGNLSDYTVDSRLRYHGWNAKTEIEDVMEAFNFDFEFGVPPGYLSGKYADMWAPFDAHQSEAAPAVNDPRGFQSLVQMLARNGAQQNDSIEERVVFDKVVSDIVQTSEGVDVLTLDGFHYHGDYVIVTFSVGVLQSRNVDFSPKLPNCKQMSFDKFGISPFTHIYLKFPSTFWDDTLFILYASEQRSKYGVYVNVNHVMPGSHVLQLSVWHEEARRVERLQDQDIVQDILRHLRAMYPSHVIPFPDDYAISRWTYDPLTYGAYSYWPTGFTEDNMADMMAPFGRVYFAGEHLDPLQYSYVHAAYTSGIKTANQVLDCIQAEGHCEANVTSFRCSSQSEASGVCVASAVSVHTPIMYSMLCWTVAFTAFLRISLTL